jgi:hypothetical protein
LVPLPTDRCDIDGPTAGDGQTLRATRGGAALAAKAYSPSTCRPPHARDGGTPPPPPREPRASPAAPVWAV